MVRIIDLHTHCNCGLKDDCPETEIHKRNFDFLMEDYKSAGISVGGFSYFSALLGTSEIYESNELLYKQSKTDDRVYQWIVLDPRQDKLFSQIAEKIKGEKVLGIKIHSPCHNYDINDYGDKIFGFANELQCFVLMHPDKIPEMVKFADKYPKMNLIIAHLGSVEHVDAIKNAKHGNIYTDTSGMASFNNNIIEYAIEKVGSEKIFFGTDTYACGFQKGRIEYARISDKGKENIFYNNAKTHFSIQI
ncbi:MAG: amidohydrolase [Clostridia bacterium]|nr:amidohydrolase [Clostridia bacterium]